MANEPIRKRRSYNTEADLKVNVFWSKMPWRIRFGTEKEAQTFRARLYAARKRMQDEFRHRYNGFRLIIHEREDGWILEATQADKLFDDALSQIGGAQPDSEAPPLRDIELYIPEPGYKKENARSKQSTHLSDSYGDLTAPKLNPDFKG